MYQENVNVRMSLGGHQAKEMAGILPASASEIPRGLTEQARTLELITEALAHLSNRLEPVSCREVAREIEQDPSSPYPSSPIAVQIKSHTELLEGLLQFIHLITNSLEV